MLCCAVPCCAVMVVLVVLVVLVVVAAREWVGLGCIFVVGEVALSARGRRKF